MIKVGITGQSGFIGTHFFNYLSLKENEINLIPFKDELFSTEKELIKWTKNCDVIVHLAALNRHTDPQIIYNTNIKLVEKLIESIERAGTKPHVIFSSSTQEELDNTYGKSKKDGRILFEKWAKKSGSKFTGLIIPNVFGPFGLPFYNSVVATFCHQLTHEEKPEIVVDNELKLIYVQELAEVIYSIIIQGTSRNTYDIAHTSLNKVTDILKKLQYFKEQYYEKNIVPVLSSNFEIHLFNTFRSYFDYSKHYQVFLNKNEDERGNFTETIKSHIGGQFSFSTTKPGITRGNHFHIRKIERFIVIKGDALIRLRRIGTKDILEFRISGDKPAFIDMPVWYTHNITNIGKDELYTLFWVNEFFNSSDSDTFYEEV
jgi:UDP-2-acetamido-2,6-beta-L-arabino-hexul-4-ose reductase